MHGLMNNTKWRELLTIISAYPVYIQLKIVNDMDFHIDQERADWAISNIDKDQFTYIKRTIKYHQIDKLKIKNQPRPKELTAGKHEELFFRIKRLITDNIQSSQDSLIVSGYQTSNSSRKTAQ